MTNLWCVRAEFGEYTDCFVKGGFVAINWMPKIDLSKINSRDELYPLYKEAYPEDISTIVIGQQVGQIARFLLEMKGGDYVITPASETENLQYGQINSEHSYQYVPGDDSCPYPHRRIVK